MNNITIRALTEDDKTVVRALDELSGNYVEQWLDSTDYSWGMFLDDTLIGYCTTGYADDCSDSIENHSLHTCDSILLSDVFIIPTHRHNGYASLMIRKALKLRHDGDGYNETVFLSLLYDSLSALYEPLGFSFIDDNGHMVLPKQKAGENT